MSYSFLTTAHGVQQLLKERCISTYGQHGATLTSAKRERYRRRDYDFGVVSGQDGSDFGLITADVWEGVERRRSSQELASIQRSAVQKLSFLLSGTLPHDAEWLDLDIRRWPRANFGVRAIPW